MVSRAEDRRVDAAAVNGDGIAGLKSDPLRSLRRCLQRSILRRRDRQYRQWRRWRWPSRRLAAAMCDDHRDAESGHDDACERTAAHMNAPRATAKVSVEDSQERLKSSSGAARLGSGAERIRRAEDGSGEARSAACRQPRGAGTDNVWDAAWRHHETAHGHIGLRIRLPASKSVPWACCCRRAQSRAQRGHPAMLPPGHAGKGPRPATHTRRGRFRRALQSIRRA